MFVVQSHFWKMNACERIRESIEDDENATGNDSNTGRQESATANPHVFGQEKNSHQGGNS